MPELHPHSGIQSVSGLIIIVDFGQISKNTTECDAIPVHLSVAGGNCILHLTRVSIGIVSRSKMHITNILQRFVNETLAEQIAHH